jgi:hypothetical protein
MIKGTLSFILLTVFSWIHAQESAQKPTLLKAYELISITGKADVTVTGGRRTLTFITVSGTDEINFYKLKYKLNVNLNDTLISMEWDPEKKSSYSEKYPVTGLFRLESPQQALVKKSWLSEDRHRIVTAKRFRIFKWTPELLVMEDQSTPGVTTVYTFKAIENTQ